MTTRTIKSILSKVFDPGERNDYGTASYEFCSWFWGAHPEWDKKYFRDYTAEAAYLIITYPKEFERYRVMKRVGAIVEDTNALEFFVEMGPEDWSNDEYPSGEAEFQALRRKLNAKSKRK